jgi:site-specific DNA-methyltransferase (adenine-specific)
MLQTNQIYLGDCLSVMQEIDDKSVDLILCDLPYGNFTACHWDVLIDFTQLWLSYNRIIKDNGIVLLFGSQPFTTAIISSNLESFKYCWYWRKSKPNGWQHSKNKPMTAIEEICVFSKAKMGHVSQCGNNRMRYNPQGIRSIGNKKVTAVAHGNMMGARPNQIGKEYEAFTGFPNNVLEYANVIGKQALHPTQKPVELLEYLIKTYTKENDIVLDNCFGSGSTLVAAKNLNRQFIGIEKEEKYFNIAKERLNLC